MGSFSETRAMSAGSAMPTIFAVSSGRGRAGHYRPASRYAWAAGRSGSAEGAGHELVAVEIAEIATVEAVAARTRCALVGTAERERLRVIRRVRRVDHLRIRRREERYGKLARQYEEARRDCSRGDDEACSDARSIYAEMDAMRASVPYEARD